LDFTAVVSKGEKGNFRNPIGGLIRFQFLEILVRAGVRKYFDNAKTAETRVDAVKMHLDQAMLTFGKHDLYLNWRKERYFNEECDIVFKHYLRVIKVTYK
jgi:hypothetical protein